MSENKNDRIIIRGAREHNLKNVDVEIPRNKITVITGLSGSGKSSLAFDTLYAEGQRRYIEGLSAYAKQFLDQLKKPDVESITGISPTIAIDQKSVGYNPRSTVGTITETYDFLRLLYAKVGVPYCPEHNIPVTSQKPEQIIAEISKLKAGTQFYILAPMAQGKKGEFLAEFQKWAKKGFIKARVDGEFVELTKAKKLAKTKAHDIDLVVDQLIQKPELKHRLAESVNTALSMGKGQVVLEIVRGERKIFSIHSACPICSYSFNDLEPRMFSYNNPRGWCESCHGLGTQDITEEETIDYADGEKVSKGTKYIAKNKKAVKDDDEDLFDEVVTSDCQVCSGDRLNRAALSVKINKKNIADLSRVSVDEVKDWILSINWPAKDQLIVGKIVEQIVARIDYLIRVGTGYLSLARVSHTLSGGESQRIRLASQVGSGLVGVTYVMDEPSIGLHPRDHQRLLHILEEIKNRGNTIVLVEHDEETILHADYVIDLGPRAGKLGGAILALGTPEEIAKNPKSLTGQYLSQKKSIPIPVDRRKPANYLEILGASGNNLKNVDVKIPLGVLCVITGVSGSGKSTLIIDTLYKNLAQHFYKSSVIPSPFKKIKGLENIDKVIEINQKPIGRTPRSTPATYVGLFPLIRDLFASLPEAKLRGYPPGRFSFNVKGGRCEHCQGHGQIRVEMNFLSDVFVPCDICLGSRYNRETLSIRYKDKSIYDVLNMSVEEALEFFKNHKVVHRKIETLKRVGLDYITLGQSSTTLSGGEAQRIKLSRELSKRGTGKTMYILDEPTTGLHFDDIYKLSELIGELVDQGNSVLVIEHNLDIIKTADYIIDMGPEGGRGGGEVVAVGTPEEIVQSKRSLTAPFLKKSLKNKK